MDRRPGIVLLRTLFCTLCIGAALCNRTSFAAESEVPPTPSQENFSLVDESGNSPTDLGIDPHIDPLQVGLDSTTLITAHNVLGLVFQQSAAARQLWFVFAGVGLGLLIFSTLLVRLRYRPRTVTALFSLWALAFIVFAYAHWTALDTVRQQQRLLTTLVQHAVDQSSAPALLVPLAVTTQPLPRELLAAVHLCLDLLVLGTMLLLWLQGKRDRP